MISLDKNEQVVSSDKLRFMKLVYALGLIFACYAVYSDYSSDGRLDKYYDIYIAIFCSAVLFFCRYRRLTVFVVRLTLISAFGVFSIAAFTQMHKVEMFLWFPIYPFIFFYLSNHREGLIWSVVLAMVLVIAYNVYPLLPYPQRVDSLLFGQVVLTLIFATVLAFAYEKIRHEQKQKLHALAELDYLTQLYNRRGLALQMDDELNRIQRYGNSLSFMLMDVDDFKQINDRYGHKHGDEFLKQLAQLLRSNIRRSDILARWGGEEFAVIMPEVGIENARQMAEKLRLLIQEHVFPEIGSMTVSIGVTQYQAGDGLDDLTLRADRALYRAKEHNKNRVEVNPPGADSGAPDTGND